MSFKPHLRNGYLQEVELLLTGILTADHVFDNALYSSQDSLVMAERQDIGDLSIKQGVDHREHLWWGLSLS